jgi:hypothetical protein
LLFEIVALGFVLEGHLDDAGARRADGFADRQRDLHRVAGGVVVDRDAAVDAFALLVLFAHEHARRIGHEQHRVDVLRRDDLAIEHAEAVAEAERLTRAEVRRDVFFIDRRLHRVGELDQQNVGLLRRFGDGEGFEPIGLRLLARFAPFVRAAAADDDAKTAVARVRRLRLALDAVADDGDRLVLQDRRIDVGVAVDFFAHLNPHSPQRRRGRRASLIEVIHHALDAQSEHFDVKVDQQAESAVA